MFMHARQRTSAAIKAFVSVENVPLAGIVSSFPFYFSAATMFLHRRQLFRFSHYLQPFSTALLLVLTSHQDVLSSKFSRKEDPP